MRRQERQKGRRNGERIFEGIHITQGTYWKQA